jgi:hypothetical protein
VPPLAFISTRRPNSVCTTTVTRLRRVGPRSVMNAASDWAAEVRCASRSRLSSVCVSQPPRSIVATCRPTSARSIDAMSFSACEKEPLG